MITTIHKKGGGGGKNKVASVIVPLGAPGCKKHEGRGKQERRRTIPGIAWGERKVRLHMASSPPRREGKFFTPLYTPAERVLVERGPNRECSAKHLRTSRKKERCFQ